MNIQLTQDEYEHIRLMFEMLKDWYQAESGRKDYAGIEPALDKILTVLQPEYLPTHAENEETWEGLDTTPTKWITNNNRYRDIFEDDDDDCL